MQPCKDPLRERAKPRDVRKQPGIKAAPRELRHKRESSCHPLNITVSQRHAEGAAVIAEVFHPKPGLQIGGGNLTLAL